MTREAKLEAALKEAMLDTSGWYCNARAAIAMPATEPHGYVEVAKDRADWLLDAVACATQNRQFLRGEPEYDEVAGEAILLNGEKAISVAISRALATRPAPQPAADTRVVPISLLRQLNKLSGYVHENEIRQIIGKHEK